MKYLKSLTWILIPIFILSFLVSVLYYLDWINTNIYKILELIVPCLSIFLGGLYLGKHSQEKGWLEGIKLGGITILLLFIISYLAFDIGVSLKGTIYYLIILFTTTFGSMMGIRNVDNQKK